MLKMYLHDLSHLLSYESLEVNPKLTYKERPMKILDRKKKGEKVGQQDSATGEGAIA